MPAIMLWLLFLLGFVHPGEFSCKTAHVDCGNGGYCFPLELDGQNTYYCKCREGFSGGSCEKRDHCHQNPCKNEGTCMNYHEDPHYRCHCSNGFTGRNCESLQRGCTSQSCNHFGTCKPANNTLGFTCECSHGFSGKRCENNVHCLSNPCVNNGVCHPVQHAPYFSCRCPEGFYGLYCKYIDGCAVNPCPQGLKCSKLHSTYRCECNSQSTCDNLHEVDHCASQPCQHYGQCNNQTQPPYYRCSCKYGFSGDTCQINNNCGQSRCQNGGVCYELDQLPFFSCQCKTGYYGNLCEYTDHCLSSPCPLESVCHPVIYGKYYQCQCKPGHTCQTVNKCLANPCQNNGNCSQVTDDPYYHCTCPEGYSGINCEHHICDSSNCTHGTCVKTATTPFFECSCPLEYHGHHCEVTSCKERFCRNEGTCIPLDHPPYHKCNCAPGFTGRKCGKSLSTNTTTTITTTTITTLPTTQSATTKSTLLWLYFTHTKPTTHITPSGPTCLSCSDVVAPDTCEFIQHCGAHELCFIEEFVSTIGSIRFNMGCRDTKKCGTGISKRNAGSVINNNDTALGEEDDNPLICTDCCVGHLCNSGGCGTNAFPSLNSGQRGPVCYHCDQQTSPDDCHKVTICGLDEVCMLNTTTVGTSHKTLWKSDCQLATTCHQEKRSMATNFAAAIDSHKCCPTDLCNNSL